MRKSFFRISLFVMVLFSFQAFAFDASPPDKTQLEFNLDAVQQHVGSVEILTFHASGDGLSAGNGYFDNHANTNQTKMPTIKLDDPIPIDGHDPISQWTNPDKQFMVSFLGNDAVRQNQNFDRMRRA